MHTFCHYCFSKQKQQGSLFGGDGGIGINNINRLWLNTSCLVLANSVDPNHLASGEANWSGSALFVIKYVNLYQKLGSSNLIKYVNLDQVIWLAGNYKWVWHLNLFSMRRVKSVPLAPLHQGFWNFKHTSAMMTHAHCHWPLLTRTYFSCLAKQCSVCVYSSFFLNTTSSHAI